MTDLEGRWLVEIRNWDKPTQWDTKVVTVETPPADATSLRRRLAQAERERDEARVYAQDQLDWALEERNHNARLRERVAGLELRPSDRIIIVYDGHAWFVRRLAVSEHDMDRDQMVYRCDEPLVNDAATLGAALAALAALPDPEPGEPPPVQTHWPDCWRDRRHHACAVARVEALEAALPDGVVVTMGPGGPEPGEEGA